MTKQEINIVWLKRDIRSQDHQPLYEAEKSGLPYLIIFLFEPSIISYPDTSIRHLQFQYHSILTLNNKLSAYQRKVEIMHAEASVALKHIFNCYEVRTMFSYQESGIQHTYNRDLEINKICKENQIQWREFQRDGIIRGIKNRVGWDQKWYATMHSALIQNTYSIQTDIHYDNPFPLSQELRSQLENYPKEYQPAGEDYAYKYLASFVQGRGKNYSRHISKPMESRTSCIRISPYLSWGNLSIKQAYQFVLAYTKEGSYVAALKNSMTRLKWHCHFIQKFEQECRYERFCINAGYEVLEHPRNEAYLQAWKEGKTGFPLIDACMRCLIATGWINFRMRAMLVSFVCHHLFQDWRDATYHMAQLFLDYEPGIHYPQFQMQAGTTGINIVRMYNPIKQSQEHDPYGYFIKKWLPELSLVPSEYIHEPHLLSLDDQQKYGVSLGQDYPFPIVQIDISGKFARDQIWGHRKNEMVERENIRILNTHTRKFQLQ
jgi:deoxyribodipyrimidine photo-lyase